MSDLKARNQDHQKQHVQDANRGILGEFSSFTTETIRLPGAFLPLMQLISNDRDVPASPGVV